MSTTRSSILYVTLSLDRGGTEKHLAEIAPRLAAGGWPITVYCVLSRGVMADAVAATGVTVIGPPISMRGGVLKIRSIVHLLLAAGKLFHVMATRRPTIVHFYLPGPYLIGGPLSLLTGRPVHVMSRRNQNRYQTRRPLARLIERFLHQKMTAILGNSREVVRELIETEGCDPERVGLIYNGVDIARFTEPVDRAAVRSSFGIGEARLVLVVVANLFPYKGHADLFRALARVKDRLPQPWVLLCAGRDDGYLETLEDVAYRQGIADQVVFLGSRPDVPAILRSADIGLLCSHEEGFSNAILEGMAAGLPMIVTNVGGNAEAVIHGVTGLVVPSLDPHSLADAIVTIANDREKSLRMGEAAARRARERFSIERCVADYERLYEGLLKGEKASTLALAATEDGEAGRGQAPPQEASRAGATSSP